MESENVHLAVIRIWAAAAWADGSLVGAERQVLQRLIERADLDAEARTTAMGFLEQAVELDSARPETLSEDERVAVYRSACRLAGIDLHVAEEERTFLTRLRGVLDLADDVADAIEKSAGFGGRG